MRFAGILSDVKSTCYPAARFRTVLAKPSEELVVFDKNIITSQGPGTSLKFALALVEILYGKEKLDKLSAEMLA